MRDPSHFHPLGRAPSAATVAVQQAVRASLPFTDERDFEEARLGRVAVPGYRQIMARSGNVAWDIGSYDFVLDGREFDSIHPLAAAAGRPEHGVRAVRGGATTARWSTTLGR